MNNGARKGTKRFSKRPHVGKKPRRTGPKPLVLGDLKVTPKGGDLFAVGSLIPSQSPEFLRQQDAQRLAVTSILIRTNFFKLMLPPLKDMFKELQTARIAHQDPNYQRFLFECQRQLDPIKKALQNKDFIPGEKFSNPYLLDICAELAQLMQENDKLNQVLKGKTKWFNSAALIWHRAISCSAQAILSSKNPADLKELREEMLKKIISAFQQHTALDQQILVQFFKIHCSGKNLVQMLKEYQIELQYRAHVHAAPVPYQAAKPPLTYQYDIERKSSSSPLSSKQKEDDEFILHGDLEGGDIVDYIKPPQI